MEIRPIDANHLKYRVMNESASVPDATLDAVRLIMNLRFDALIDTEPTIEEMTENAFDKFAQVLEQAEKEGAPLEPTFMEIVEDEGFPRPVRCIKCGSRYALNAEWLEDGAVAIPKFCPICGRPVGSIERWDENGG